MASCSARPTQPVEASIQAFEDPFCLFVTLAATLWHAPSRSEGCKLGVAPESRQRQQLAHRRLLQVGPTVRAVKALIQIKSSFAWLYTSCSQLSCFVLYPSPLHACLLH